MTAAIPAFLPHAVIVTAKARDRAQNLEAMALELVEIVALEDDRSSDLGTSPDSRD